MLSIGRFAKLANVSPRTVRYYESIGLIKSASRGENNYRYYDSHLVDRVAQIRDLQELGFSLDEIKDILKISPSDFAQSLKKKLAEVDGDITTLRERRQRLMSLLSVSQKIVSKEAINDTERTNFMTAIQEEILNNLKTMHGDLSEAQLAYLKRDRTLETEEQRDFIEALKKCIAFAKSKNLKLGPTRGRSSSSMVLYALGLNNFDPTESGLIPERLLAQEPNVHIDVEYERGQEFVDYCRDTNKNLRYGQIQAYKMPLLDIIQNVHTRLGKEINYAEIDDNSDVVLNQFRQGDLSKIFCIDYSDDALIMKYENFLPEYTGLDKIREYIHSQKVHSFRDVMNIIALWRPSSAIQLERIDRYRKAKEKPFTYKVLTPELRKSLEPNFGMIIYHEDLMRILAHYTGFSLERSLPLIGTINCPMNKSPERLADLLEFKKVAPPEVVQLILEEAPHSFCQPHIFAFSFFTKITAVLKSLHQDIYFEEIAKWEAKNGFRWDDIGVNWKGVSLLQN